MLFDCFGFRNVGINFRFYSSNSNILNQVRLYFDFLNFVLHYMQKLCVVEFHLEPLLLTSLMTYFVMFLFSFIYCTTHRKIIALKQQIITL